MTAFPKTSESPLPPAPARFLVGVYARLSVEGGPDSIAAQIAIATEYIKAHPDMELVHCYTDNGRTGTNFGRAGFEQMMRDVREQRINCIIVKDLSRFGRNHIEVGNYIQKIFPFMGVRFIAVTDRIDTLSQSGGTQLTLNLKNLVNEMYAKDIARKVKTSKESSKRAGSYTGGVPPYGYCLERAGLIRRLVICPGTSEIVKEIYDRFLSGNPMRQIIRQLYERGVNRPGVYAKTGRVYCENKEETELWNSGTIRRILTNPVYTKPSFSPGPDRFEAPLIRREMFCQAAEKLKNPGHGGERRRVSEDDRTEDVFNGVLFCGACKKRMIRSANRKRQGEKEKIYYNYSCPGAWRCPTGSISEGVLSRLVKTALRQELALSDLPDNWLAGVCGACREEEEKHIASEIARCDGRLESGKRQKSEWYERYRKGFLSAGEYGRLTAEKDRALSDFAGRRADLACRLEEIGREISEKEDFLKALTEGGENASLTTLAIQTLIDRIEVYGGRRVKIIWRGRRAIE